jgi:hypothetical protein
MRGNFLPEDHYRPAQFPDFINRRMISLKTEGLMVRFVSFLSVNRSRDCACPEILPFSAHGNRGGCAHHWADWKEPEIIFFISLVQENSPCNRWVIPTVDTSAPPAAGKSAISKGMCCSLLAVLGEIQP